MTTLYLVQGFMIPDEFRVGKAALYARPEPTALFAGIDAAKSYLDVVVRHDKRKRRHDSQTGYVIWQIHFDPKKELYEGALASGSWAELSTSLCEAFADGASSRAGVSDPAAGSRRYEVGDIVGIRSSAAAPGGGRSVLGDLGVVSQLPKDDEPEYAVNYVDEYGVLDRYWWEGSDLTPAAATIPDELKFLKTWSRVLRGELHLPDDLLDNLESMFIRNIETFDFLEYGANTNRATVREES